MSKIKLAVVLGTVLGLLDGLSTLFVPEAVEAGTMTGIVVGSTLKGLVSGALIGWFAERRRSLPLGLAVGLAVGLGLSYFAALVPDPEGLHHYLEIMLPGALLGLVVGFASQRWGRAGRRPAAQGEPR